MSDSPAPAAPTTWDADGFRHQVQAALEQFLDRQADRLAPLGPDAERLLAEARAVVAGGKRLRAAFCWWGHLAVAAPVDEQALVRACAALELLHASALVHDDLMDAVLSLRTSATTMGATALASLAGDVEQHVRLADTVAARRAVRRLPGAARQTCQALALSAS